MRIIFVFVFLFVGCDTGNVENEASLISDNVKKNIVFKAEGVISDHLKGIHRYSFTTVAGEVYVLDVGDGSNAPINKNCKVSGEIEESREDEITNVFINGVRFLSKGEWHIKNKMEDPFE